MEKEMAVHSSILAWRIPWTEEPGGLQSTGSQKSQIGLSESRTTTTWSISEPLSQLMGRVPPLFSLQQRGCPEVGSDLDQDHRVPISPAISAQGFRSLAMPAGR